MRNKSFNVLVKIDDKPYRSESHVRAANKWQLCSGKKKKKLYQHRGNLEPLVKLGKCWAESTTYLRYAHLGPSHNAALYFSIIIASDHDRCGSSVKMSGNRGLDDSLAG